MNYLITTTYQNINYSHIVKGLTSSEVQDIFKPDGIVPVEEGEQRLTEASGDEKKFDLEVVIKKESKEIQIISSIQKIITLYEWLKSIGKLSIVSINSISKPLTATQVSHLLQQLEAQYTQKEQSITPEVKNLVEVMQRDIDNFLIRYKGYAEEKDLDVLQTRSHDLAMFLEQGKLSQIRDRMQQVIEKMELLESNYVKQINIDTEKPLGAFNKELHTVMNQNRLFRYHGLNQLSGGSRFDFFIYKIITFLRLWHDSLDIELQNLHEVFAVFLKSFLRVVLWGLTFGLVLLALYRYFYNQNLTYPFLTFGFIGLVCMMCYGVAEKKLSVSVPLMLIFVIAGYVGYEFIRINLGL